MSALTDEDGVDGPFNREMDRLIAADAKVKRCVLCGHFCSRTMRRKSTGERVVVCRRCAP